MTTGVPGESGAVEQSHSTPVTDVDPPGVLRYVVHGTGTPGGHSRIRCNETDVKADTGSFPDGSRPGPADLLCAALAACLLKNVERFSELLPFEYQMARVEVLAERQVISPLVTRMHYSLEIASNEPEHRVDLLHRNIRKYGTITNTLAAAVELTGEVVARPHL